MYPYIHILGRTFGTYGLLVAVGCFLAGFLALRRGKPHGFILEDLLIIGASALGLGLCFGCGLYVFVTFPMDQILTWIRNGEFAFLSSGIVFYGGLIGGLLGALVGVRIAKCSFSLVEHSVVPFVPLGHAIGRIGCVMAGCCYGFPYDGFGALYYPNAVSGISPHQGYFPVQLVEAVINVVICLVLLWLGKRIKRTWNLLFSYLILYGISRFFLEMLRGDAIRGVWDGFSTSQFISMGLIAVSVAGILWRRHAQKEVQ